MAGKVVKPTPAERKIIDKRLRKKYPQMFEPGWGLKGLTKKELEKRTKERLDKVFKKSKETKREKGISKQLGEAGLTRRDISRLKRKK